MQTNSNNESNKSYDLYLNTCVKIALNSFHFVLILTDNITDV